MSYLHQNSCKLSYPVLTMGTFDGVHRGHQKLLKLMCKKAKEVGGEAVVLSYYHHPLETIHKKTFPYLLTEREKKEKFLKELGVDCILYLNFDEKLAMLPPQNFISDILVNEIGMKEIFVGYDTHFGKNRDGDFELIKEYEKEYSYKTYFVSPFRLKNRIVSSSMIRDLIREGDIETAEFYLGRRYSLIGKVVRGKRIGNRLGYPTINIEPLEHNKLIPALGVYISKIHIGKTSFWGLTNIGYSPSIKRERLKTIEAYILDFSGNLYDKKVEISFNKRLRDEKYFENPSKLITAIDEDVKALKKYILANR